MRTLSILAVLCLLCVSSSVYAGAKPYIDHWIDGATVTSGRPDRNNEKLDIYCYKGTTKNIISFFQTTKIVIDIADDNFVQFIGGTTADVYEQYAEQRSSWSVTLFSTRKPRVLHLDPFDTTCTALATELYYTLSLNVNRMDMWRILPFVVGTLLFTSSKTLSGNPLFFYLCGITVGICASFMVVVYFLSRLFPRKPMMYGIVVGGWSVGLYFLKLAWENMRSIAATYRTPLMWYFFVVGFISFVACYKVGPPSNTRNKNIVMWTLQVIGLLLVLLSSDYREASAAGCLVLLVSHYFPTKWLNFFKSYWLRRFPPKSRLLSSEEYYEQGARETRDELQKLRQYCSSPDCAQWKIMLKLNDSKRNIEHDSPVTSKCKWQPPRNISNRFASFVEGDSHLSDDEVINYESYAYASHTPRSKKLLNSNSAELSSDDSSSDEEL